MKIKENKTELRDIIEFLEWCTSDTFDSRDIAYKATELLNKYKKFTGIKDGFMYFDGKITGLDG